jgi:hypothetical protein
VVNVSAASCRELAAIFNIERICVMTTTFAPISFLRDLREECLQHSEKRMPKWKFRLAPDLVLQLQPKPTYLPTPRQIESGVKVKLLQFDGMAVLVTIGTATAEMFDKLPRGEVPWCRRTFEIIAYKDDAEWQFKPRSWICARGCRDLIPGLDERIIATFAGGFFTNLMPERLLGHHCMICGKSLTDPASMARRIGPECAGTSSLVVPFTIQLEVDHHAA